jgi:hypothetical protein
MPMGIIRNSDGSLASGEITPDQAKRFGLAFRDGGITGGLVGGLPGMVKGGLLGVGAEFIKITCDEFGQAYGPLLNDLFNQEPRE